MLLLIINTLNRNLGFAIKPLSNTIICNDENQTIDC